MKKKSAAEEYPLASSTALKIAERRIRFEDKLRKVELKRLDEVIRVVELVRDGFTYEEISHKLSMPKTRPQRLFKRALRLVGWRR